ncbi:hypothetical protein H0A36_26400 [Endozoicomonas sp. SM1973]|uniref:Glycoside hydrolase family 42 N-terminal domain-containing protein n=1 Tax=Spartinivicinus marinus TaxID=2994442 RepID=A0A853ICG9_9GAMM|nr:hypothetical protein [Spartinivicinus marinus]MCX4030336.1 hypothetical protein [Spartinivicinus marinus]NYZ69552.1 hypothetical protein [Spartinivicinus marinus]
MRNITTLLLYFLLFWQRVQADSPQNYIFTDSDSLTSPIFLREDIKGAQIVYSWKQLEKSKDNYDFSAIERDMSILKKMNKKLFVQIQDRFFEPEHRNIPLYLQNEPQYLGGLIQQSDNPGEGKPAGSGWVAMQWNSQLRERYQKLLKALSESFDGKIAGINLPETAIGIDRKKATKLGFTCDRYFSATVDNILFAKKSFKKSHVIQYVNFWPCEWNNNQGYMSKLFEIAYKNSIGLGGPDIVPYKNGHMKNSYPFFHKYQGKLDIIAMAVQQPTLTYTNPQTKNKFTKEEFIEFADHYLGVNIIFWTLDAPWLHDIVK